MAIKVRRQDGRSYMLEQLFGRRYPARNISTNQIDIKKIFFSVNPSLNLRYAVLLESSTDLFIHFSDNKVTGNIPSVHPKTHIETVSCYKRRPKGTYRTSHLHRVLGEEGIFNLEMMEEKLYKIIYPRK